MFRQIGGGEIILILAVLLLLFGAKKLPELARSLGRSAKELKEGLREGEREQVEQGQAESAESTDGLRQEPNANSQDSSSLDS